jgi:hypothetical protein
MALYYITNKDKTGPRGVNLVGGLTHYIKPDETSPALDVSDLEINALKIHSPHFVIAEARHGVVINPKRPTDELAASIVTPETVNERIAREALEGGFEEPAELHEPLDARPDFDKMEAAALRSYLTDAGVAFHPKTGHDKLVAKAVETFDALKANDRRIAAQADAAELAEQAAAQTAEQAAGEPETLAAGEASDVIV